MTEHKKYFKKSHAHPVKTKYRRVTGWTCGTCSRKVVTSCGEPDCCLYPEEWEDICDPGLDNEPEARDL